MLKIVKEGCNLDLITYYSDHGEESCAVLSECVVMSTTRDLTYKKGTNFHRWLTLICLLQIFI